MNWLIEVLSCPLLLGWGAGLSWAGFSDFTQLSERGRVNSLGVSDIDIDLDIDLDIGLDIDLDIHLLHIDIDIDIDNATDRDNPPVLMVIPTILTFTSRFSKSKA